jgi:DNA-binding IclR family transcriptional regulator
VTGETGHLAVLDGPNSLTIGVTEGWHTVRMYSWVGKSTPAYLSSMGKALLAGQHEDAVRSLYPETLATPTRRSIGTRHELVAALRRIKKHGHAVDNEELEVGLRCVAAPIVDANGAVTAALSVSGPSQRLTTDAVRQVAEHVRWIAANASRSLGARNASEGWPAFPLTPPPPLDWVEAVRQQRHAGTQPAN